MNHGSYGFHPLTLTYNGTLAQWKSVREYLTELRIEDAKRLLRHSGLSVTEIAYSTSFANPDYFSVVFKERIGCSPTAYRRREKGRHSSG